MGAKESKIHSSNPVEAAIRRLFQELNREDSQLRTYLLDAALAGLRVARSPESPETRRDAAQVWAAMEPILSRHLDSEDSHLLPWLERHSTLSPDTQGKIRECHQRLRGFIRTIVNNDIARGTAAEARDIGKALAGLAVALDDAIDDEERRLLPTFQKALFAALRQ
ncbi:MAG: hemerythrin domain-containing protein [Candidatus Binataceae bacterium]